MITALANQVLNEISRSCPNHAQISMKKFVDTPATGIEPIFTDFCMCFLSWIRSVSNLMAALFPASEHRN